MTTQARQRVAVIGVGIMGSAIARRLLGRGHELTVFDLDRSKLEPLAAPDFGPMAGTSSFRAGPDQRFSSRP